MKKIVTHSQSLPKKHSRVALNPMETNHVSHLIRLTRDPDLSRLLGWSPSFELYETDQFIQAISLFAFPYSQLSEPMAFGIYPSAQVLPIGYAVLKGINWTEGTAEIGIAILNKHYRQQGYGTLAMRKLIDYTFNELNFQLIGAAILTSNTASISLFQKIGFLVKTTLYHSWTMADGSVEDMLRMEITDQRWNELWG